MSSRPDSAIDQNPSPPLMVRVFYRPEPRPPCVQCGKHEQLPNRDICHNCRTWGDISTTTRPGGAR